MSLLRHSSYGYDPSSVAVACATAEGGRLKVHEGGRRGPPGWDPEALKPEVMIARDPRHEAGG